MPPHLLPYKTSTQGQAVYIGALSYCTKHLPWCKNPCHLYKKKIVLKHHLTLSMSSRDLNWILVVATVTNLQLLKNVLKRSRLSDYSNLWDSGLSGKSLAVNGRCSDSECLERYRLYCVHCVCGGRYQLLLHTCPGCTLYEQITKQSMIMFSITLKCPVFNKEGVEEG